LITKDLIYSATFSKVSLQKTLIESLIIFSKTKIVEYSRKYLKTDIAEDLVFIGDENIQKTTTENLTDLYKEIISNDISLNRTINTKNIHKGNDLLLFDYFDYATIIDDSIVRFVFKENDNYYIFISDIEMNINDYTIMQYFENREYSSLYDYETYDKELNIINFEETIKEEVTLKVNLKTKNNLELLDQKTKNELSKINRKGVLAKKILVAFNVSDLHFRDVYKKKLSEINISEDEELVKLLSDKEQVFNISKKSILVTDSYRDKYTNMNFDEIYLR
jgi:hypothetical protein